MKVFRQDGRSEGHGAGPGGLPDGAGETPVEILGCPPAQAVQVVMVVVITVVETVEPIEVVVLPPVVMVLVTGQVVSVV